MSVQAGKLYIYWKLIISTNQLFRHSNTIVWFILFWHGSVWGNIDKIEISKRKTFNWASAIMAFAAFVFRKVKMDVISNFGIVFPIFD